MQTDNKLINFDAESAILACVFLDSGDREITEEILTTLNVEDFGTVALQNLFLTMRKLFNRGIDIDIISVAEILERQNKLDKVGGIEQLTAISNYIPSNANYAFYLNTLKNLSKLRMLNKIAKSTTALIAEGKNADTIKAEIEKALEDLAEKENKQTVRHIHGQATEILEHIKAVRSGQYDDFGLPTGFATLDKVLWGLQKSELYVIAARAGVGKTAFGVNILNHVSKHNKVLFFSQEMSEREILYRMFAHESDIALPEIRKAKDLSDSQLESLEKVNENFEKGKFFIDDSSMTVSEMLLKAKRLKRREGLDLVLVDYLQFVKPTNKTGNRTQEVGDIARDLKRMARILNIPVVALCQLNRQLDVDDREPTLGDLRESGEIENNADVVMFLVNTGSKLEKVRKMELTIAKHRNGALAKIKLEYKGETFTFSEAKSEQKVKNEALLTPTQEEMPW